MMYNQGDILLIPIPFTDLTSNKKRPVMVLSNESYNQKTDDIIVAAITSNLVEKEFAVLITDQDMEEGRLKLDSIIRADKLYTLSQSIVVSKFGKLKQEIIQSVREKFSEII